LFVLLALATLGCECPMTKNPEVPLEKLILWPIEDLDDRASSPHDLPLISKVFAKGSEPAKNVLPRFAAYHYQGSHIVQSGDSATVTVALTDAKTGSPAGEVVARQSRRGVANQRRPAAGEMTYVRLSSAF
jgi:hypothetical protein